MFFFYYYQQLNYRMISVQMKLCVCICCIHLYIHRIFFIIFKKLSLSAVLPLFFTVVSWFFRLKHFFNFYVIFFCYNFIISLFEKKNFFFLQASSLFLLVTLTSNWNQRINKKFSLKQWKKKSIFFFSQKLPEKKK